MAKTTLHNSPLAVTYAQSVLELAWAANIAVDIRNELESLGEILVAQPVFREYLADPAISNAERSQALEKIFKGRVAPLVYNFLGVLNNHGRLRLLEQIISAFGELVDERMGNIEVDVTTAHKLGSEDLEMVRHHINVALSKNTIIHQYVDDAIIGGLIIRVGDRVVDASVKQQLRSMREHLLSASQNIRG